MSRTMSGRPELAAAPLTLFGFSVIDPIGQGAGSSIYAVSDPDSRQLYALKHVVRRQDKDSRFIEQLETEYEIGKQVTHGGLRKSIDIRLERTLLRKVTSGALVMELFDGLPLEMGLPDSMPELIRVFIHTAEALESLHAMGYVHCDLKPSNILLDGDGQVKVIDLGQACRTGTVKPRIQGTPDYIAPEQVRREPVTLRTDIFNFGATMYWCLTGRKLPTLFTLKKKENSFLFDGAMDAPSTIKPKVPENLSALVMECVRTNPAKRPADMAEIKHRLELILHVLTNPLKHQRQVSA